MPALIDVTPAGKRRASDRAYYVRNREEINTKRAAYYAAHREECIARVAAHWPSVRDDTLARRRDDRAHIRELLLSQSCDDCGGTPHDWHHVDPSTKRLSLGSSGGRSKIAVDAELSRCVPLCRSCHKLRHFQLLKEGK